MHNRAATVAEPLPPDEIAMLAEMLVSRKRGQTWCAVGAGGAGDAGAAKTTEAACSKIAGFFGALHAAPLSVPQALRTVDPSSSPGRMRIIGKAAAKQAVQEYCDPR